MFSKHSLALGQTKSNHDRSSSRLATRRRTRRCTWALEELDARVLLSIFTVTNTLDDGSTGSLRWAINQVNTDTGTVPRHDRFRHSGHRPVHDPADARRCRRSTIR